MWLCFDCFVHKSKQKISHGAEKKSLLIVSQVGKITLSLPLKTNVNFCTEKHKTLKPKCIYLRVVNL